MLRERFVQKRVVRTKDFQYGTILLKQVRKKLNGFLGHRPAQAGERWEMPLALLVEMLEVIDVQPLAGKLCGQSANLRIAQHAPRLSFEHYSAHAAGHRLPPAATRHPVAMTKGSNSAGSPVPNRKQALDPRRPPVSRRDTKTRG